MEMQVEMFSMIRRGGGCAEERKRKGKQEIGDFGYKAGICTVITGRGHCGDADPNLNANKAICTTKPRYTAGVSDPRNTISK